MGPGMMDPGAMAALAAVPGTAPQAPPDVAALLGAQPGMGQQPSPQASAQEAAKAVMVQFRDAMAPVDGLARQFPEASELLDQVKKLMVQAMTRVVGSLSVPEAPAPQVLG